MTQVTQYTTADSIRSAIGVDAADCPDDVIVNSNVQLELETDLMEWLPDHETIYSEGNAATATAAQKLKKNYLVLYAQYFGGYLLAIRPLSFPQIVTDGKNQMNRFPKLQADEIAKAAAANMNKYRTKLDELHNGAVAADLPIMAVSVPDYDPVAGV